MMTHEDISALFTRDDGSFLCARWGRPVAPVIFGLADESLDIFRGAISAGYAHAKHPVTEVDPELGSNLMLFFMRDWAEMENIPDLDRLTGQPGLHSRLAQGEADQYRLFRFDADGGIRACMIFLRLSEAMALAHPAALAESLMMRSALTFAAEITPTTELAALIRAAYDPVLPVATDQPAHALRLAARLARD